MAAQKLTSLVLLLDLKQLVVVLKEECQVLVGDIDFEVAAFLAMLLNGLSASRFGILVDLLLDLSGCIRDQNGRVGHAAAHLRLLTLQGGEER